MGKRLLFFVAGAWLLGISLSTASAQKEEDRLGLTCTQVLAMKPDQWAEYYNKKNPGGEAGYDHAYESYAECMKRRNDTALTKLPRLSAGRMRRYRALCGKFRVDNLEFQQAYAGGGTMYTHAMVRGLVEDEELIARLARIYSMSAPAGHAAGSRLARIKARLATLNPATAANQKKLGEFSAVEQGRTAYRDVRQDIAALEPLLATERPEARRAIVKFLDRASRVFGG